MFCPNYKNREVFDGFNEMIEAFGGKPMTEEEFRSGELRNQRTGLDYLAMEATYRLYDLNGGNFLDLAPNGKPSLLFLSLLSLYNGDRAKAIVAKSRYYTEKYRSENVDWLNLSEIEASEYNKILLYILKKTADKYDNVVDYLYTRFKKYFGTSIATDIVLYIYSNIDNGDYLKNEHIYDIIDFYLRNKLKDRVDHLINLHPNEGHVPIDAKSFIILMIKLAKENKLTFNLNEDSKLLKLKTNNVYINTLLKYLFPDYYTYNFESKKSNKDILKRLHNKNIKYDNIIDHFNKTEIFNNLLRIEKLKLIKKSLDKYLYKEKYIKLITNDILNYYKAKLSNENDNTNDVANRKTISWEDALESSSIISNAQSGTIVINSKEYKTYSMKAILNNIKNNSKRFSKLADLILQKVSGDFSVIFRSSNVENADQNVAVTWGAHASDGNYYLYISINLDNIDLFYIDPVKFFMHEAIHSVTVKLLKENDELSKQLLKYVEYVRLQLPLGIGKTGDYLMFDEYYGFKNEKEFIAEFFTNEDFLNELKHIKASDETTFKSFFDLILDFIIELFTNTANTIYDEIKPVMEKVLDMGLDSTEYFDLLPHVLFIQHATENKLDINGEPINTNLLQTSDSQVQLVFDRIPQLREIGTEEEYRQYIDSIFPNSVDKNIYWHGSNSDFSEGFDSAKREKGSGAPETQSRHDFYLAKLAWSVLQYVDGVNRKSVDKNGFAHWNKLWWELKEIMSNGRRETNDWKDIVIGEDSVRQAIPNKKGVFNRDSGGGNGKWLSERKADYGYENKSDKEFFEEVLGIRWGEDTFNTWVSRNAEIFKQLLKTEKGIYPAIINVQNPIRESGQNTYYEELRGLFTKAEREGFDSILGEKTDNEFGSDVAVVINASDKNVHFLGTKLDIEAFKKWKSKPTYSPNKKFLTATPIDTLGQKAVEDMSEQGQTSSSGIIDHMYQNQLFSDYNLGMALTLSKHQIPVVFEKLDGVRIMTTRTLKDGLSYIVIDLNKINQVSNRYIADKFLHEVLHAITVPAITNPISTEEKALSAINSQVYNIFNKAFPKDKYSRNTQLYYGLTNQKEFISEFLTNSEFRSAIYTMSKKLDSKQTYLSLKKFINRITRFILNKNIFNDITEDQLKLYEKNVKRYLFNIRPMSSKSLVELFNDAYESMIDTNIDNENFIKLALIHDLNFQAIELNDILDLKNGNTSEFTGPMSKDKAVEKLFILSKNISTMLSKRLAAVLNTNLPELEKENQKLLLRPQIDLFKNYTENYFKNLCMLIVPISSQLFKDSKTIKKLILTGTASTDSDYMYLRHANFGVYERILGEIKSLLDHNSVKMVLLEQMRENPTEDEFNVVKDVDKLVDLVNDAYLLAHTNYEETKKLLIQNLKIKFAKDAEDLNFIELLDYAETLEAPSAEDTNSLFKFFGSVDRAKDPALRLLHNKVYNAITKADRDTHDKAVDLLSAADNLKTGESVEDLYEKNEYGLTTGYVVRKYNYGQMYEDYDKFLILLNKKYNLAEDNRVAPSDNDELRKKWNEDRNKWLAEHVERKYKPEYYEAYSLLSYETQRARASIQNLISIIKQKCKDNNGFYHFELLTEEEFQTLQGLYAAKKQLQSDYNVDGSRKDEDSTEYKIAKELQQLNKFLRDHGSNTIKKNKKEWQKQRLRIIELCGGMQKYESESDDFDWETYNKWNDRNSSYQLKINEETNKPIVLELIENESQYLRIYEVDGDGGKRFQELNEEKKELLKPSRDINTGKPDPRRLNKNVRERIRKIDDELNKIRKLSKQQSKQERKAAREKRKLFSKYVKFEWSDLYRDLYNKAKKRELVLPGYLNLFKLQTGKYVKVEDEYEGESMTEFRPDPWFITMVAKDESLMELVPGDGWVSMDDDETNNLLNENWDESEGSSWIPKSSIKRYDNSTAFNKIQNSPTLKSLYELTLKTIKESNEMMPNRLFHDDYLLPQMTGSFLKRVLAQQGKFGVLRAAWSYVIEGAGVIAPNDTDYGETINNIMQDVDELGSLLSGDDTFTSNKSTINKIWFGEDVGGIMPDNRQLNMIPQYYTKKLKDTSQLSSDLIGILCEYYNNASKFKNKNAIKDECESIIDYLEDREYVGKKGGTSNTYKMGKKFLEMNLYNVRNQKYTIGNINFGKTGAVFRMLVTALNLGLNPVVAATGYFTTMFGHLINALTGQKYSLKDAFSAANYVFWYILKNAGGATYISNPLSKDKMMICAEKYNISNQLLRKYKYSNRPRLFNAINENHTFGFLTAFDFLSKSTIMVSVLMSFREMNGHFYTEEDIIRNNWNESEENLNKLKEQRNSGKTLWSVIDVKHGKFYVKPGYEKAYKEVESIVNARILKYAEAADGMATETQKAQITTNFLGACILIHRQYFPLTIQDRFGNTVFDPDVQQYTGGVFRTLWDVFRAFVWDGWNDISLKDMSLKSAFSGGVLGSAFGMPFGPVGTLIGSTVGAALGAIKSKQFNDVVNHRKSLSFQNLETDAQKRDYALLAITKNYHIRLMISEFLMYHLVVSNVAMLLNLLAARPEYKDDKLIQWLAYLSRRVQWETYNPYRLDDMINNFRTPSAALGTIDKVEAVFNDAVKTIFPHGSLLDTFLYTNYDHTENPYVQRGVYSKQGLGFYENNDLENHYGIFDKYHLWSKKERNIFKLFPAHHIFEQWYDSSSKNRFFTNQIMKLDETE